MKKSIHPTYHDNAKVVCSCGNTFTLGSTITDIKVELCSKCHPYYTGQVKYVDTLGRVQRFQKQQKEAQSYQAQILEKKTKKIEEKKREANAPKTLREMLLGH